MIEDIFGLTNETSWKYPSDQ